MLMALLALSCNAVPAHGPVVRDPRPPSPATVVAPGAAATPEPRAPGSLPTRNQAVREHRTTVLGLSVASSRALVSREVGADSVMLLPEGANAPAPGRPALYVFLGRVSADMLQTAGREEALHTMMATFMATARHGAPSQRSFATGPVTGERVSTTIPRPAELECYLVDVTGVGTVFVGFSHAPPTGDAEAEQLFADIAATLAHS